ncbi:MAG: DUF547 domain-containing protein [Cyclobacteriaceae bacterium]
MKKIILLLLLSATSILSNGADVKSFLASSDLFFKKYVDNGSVRYTKIKNSIGEIEALYQQVGEMKLDGADDNSKKAFFINSYNVIVIYWVVKHYPLKSPLDDSGFFDKVKHKVAGEEMTLNSLEIKKLLTPYKDARFHFALACAAKSCPPLASFAYMPSTLDKQLTERATAALNNPGWLKVNASQKKVELSKIFDWYKKDFTGDGKTEIEWINQYRAEKIPTSYAVGFYEYNWALNEK